MSSEIKKLVSEGESERLELCGAKTHLETLGKTVCGMLNQQGGTIVVGVDDSGKIVGLENSEALVDQLHKFVMTKVNPKPLFSASVDEVDGKAVVLIEVPRGADKPYSLDRVFYVRIGQGTFAAQPDAVSEMVEVQANVNERWELQVVPGFAIPDCDRTELKVTRDELEEAGRFGTDIPHNDDDLLRELRLSRSGQLTHAAMVLFAKEPLAWSPNLSVRIVSYATDKAGPISNDVQFYGPAVRVLREAITTILQRTGYSGQFDSNSIRRMDRPAYALFALREGLVNAIVHRDYEVVGGVIRVEIFPEHLIIRNPGELPKGWEPADLKKEHSSIPGNPDVARVFYLRGLMEQLGMGTQKLVAECKHLGAKQPAWNDDQRTVSLTLYRAPEPEQTITLTDRQEVFLASTAAGQSCKTSDYATATGVVARQAQRELGELVDWGFFERKGKGPSTVYRRTEKAK